MTKTDYNKVKPKVKPLDEANEMMDKHIQPVVKAKVKKSGVGKWLGNVFFGEEGFRGWSGHMFYEVVVPSIQNGLADMATTAIQRAIFGQDYIHARRTTPGYWGRGANNVTRIDSWRDNNRQDYTQNFAKRSRKASNYVEELIFDTRQDAQEVFNIMMAKMAFAQPYQESFTDDATVMEQFGCKISLVEGNQENIKITTPLDLKLAEILINEKQPKD